ncbi:putative DNA-binding transcriptional regulator YafY [Chitinivorax tropicus]|uniref:Putative DNA-binding transcriptional regulator YafY n=1 Tax=Chitinivorax tropicus TaxID=714531 RepID=A0A840MJX5_9PROT|nr:YafY family protein [Chitinivorax tropicus]MBB5017469.1 putative DNA-binding transcriptional regulator YafY [Chitinivorax tropicus]
MRRADRLFQIVQLLRGRRTVLTAQALAEALNISVRTVYRDIADLMASGVPIDGEAGVGYRLAHGFDLPPLMFDRSELESLLVAARLLKAWGEPQLARSAQSALSKIEAVLPKDLRPSLGQSGFYAVEMRHYPVAQLTPLREAILGQYKIRFDYIRADGVGSSRCVWPLGVFFWGTVWTLSAWCELRDDFRNFRVDRMVTIQVEPERYPHQAGRTLDDCLQRMCEGEMPG